MSGVRMCGVGDWTSVRSVRVLVTGIIDDIRQGVEKTDQRAKQLLEKRYNRVQIIDLVMSYFVDQKNRPKIT